MPQDGHKRAPRGPQDEPKKAQVDPKMPQDGPKRAPRGHKMTTDARANVLNINPFLVSMSWRQYVAGALGSKVSKGRVRERVKQCSLSIDQSDLYMVAEQ